MKKINDELIREAREYISIVLTTELSENCVFHTISHTLDVVSNAEVIGSYCMLDENSMNILRMSALFHDVGRFPQFQKYRTYNDMASENHCLLALKVLAEHNVLSALDEDERAVIEKAVEFHGAKELPELDERTLYFTKLVRDADKIDIFELLAENYRILANDPENFKWELEFPDTPECNPEIIDALMNHQLIHYDQIKTINDAKLLQLGWVYDIYFDYSLKQIYNRGCLQTIIDLLPKTDEVRQATECVLNYAAGRVQQSR